MYDQRNKGKVEANEWCYKLELKDEIKSIIQTLLKSNRSGISFNGFDDVWSQGDF